MTAPDPLDEAMYEVYLHAWRTCTVEMTTEAKEAALAAVLRYDRALKVGSPGDAEDLLTRQSLAWWDQP